MKLIVVTLLGLVTILGILLINQTSDVLSDLQVNGVSLVSPNSQVDSTTMSQMKRINASWVALIPFAFSRQGYPGVYFNHQHQWWGETVAGSRELVELARKNGYKVMLKPHVWMREGWIGAYDLASEDDWGEWEKQYTDYVMAYVRLAKELDVELFCVGTELKQAVVKRPIYWRKLIDEIQQVYGGKLTYAANWDNYSNIQFWDQLDYIGVDAYFPLVDSPSPTLAELNKACAGLKEQLQRYSERERKPMLFTEFGYRSAKGAVGNHWEVAGDAEPDMEVQVLAYEALFSTFWEEDWFAGGFLWKWHLNEDRRGLDNEFTPQGKPVEEVIRKWYLHTNLSE